MQVFCHALLVFYYIERAQDKLQAAGSYLLWERHYKMVKTLVSMISKMQRFGAHNSPCTKLHMHSIRKFGRSSGNPKGEKQKLDGFQSLKPAALTENQLLCLCHLHGRSCRDGKLVSLLQEFSCGWITTTGLASVTGLFLTKHVTSCSAIIFPWVGILPLQVLIIHLNPLNHQ